MIKSFNFIFLLTLVILVSSCGKDKDGYQQTKSGLKYKFISSSKGTKPQIGDVMLMDITYYTPSDSLLYDSRTVKDSFTVVHVEPTFVGGVEEGFTMMSPGDSAHFKVSADSLFLNTFQSTLPPYLKAGDFIHFRVLMKKIVPKSMSDSLDSARDVEMRRQEFVLLESFLKQNNMEVMPTQNGAYMSVTKAGTGEMPQAGDTIFVAYTGRLLDGTVFDQSIGVEPPFYFVLGERKVIEGWEECFPMLNNGSVARLVIPSDLAYGGDDYGQLKGYSTLVFDVEVLDVK